MKTIITIEDGKVTVQTDDVPKPKKLNLKPLSINKIKFIKTLSTIDVSTDTDYVSRLNDKQKAWNGSIKPVPAKQSDIVPTISSEAKEVTKVMQEKRASFDDPWDCGVCRNAGDVCEMHESMELDGKKPPRYKQY